MDGTDDITATLFLSTLSLRRATLFPIFVHPSALYFYPRSPCGERRKNLFPFGCYLSYFYPRSPCGERLAAGAVLFNGHNFYPRSPCGERHNNGLRGCCHHDFYPRSPCGERP